MVVVDLDGVLLELGLSFDANPKYLSLKMPRVLGFLKRLHRCRLRYIEETVTADKILLL